MATSTEVIEAARIELVGKRAVIISPYHPVAEQEFIITEVVPSYHSTYITCGVLVEGDREVSFGFRGSFELVEDQQPDRMEEYGEEGW